MEPQCAARTAGVEVSTDHRPKTGAKPALDSMGETRRRSFITNEPRKKHVPPLFGHRRLFYEMNFATNANSTM